MRHVRIALAISLLTLPAGGCFEDVMTLQPLHTERTVVDEPRLVGTWKFCDPSGLDWDVTCKVTETTDHGYRIVVDANGQKRTYIGYVVQIAKMQIIDLAAEPTGKQASAPDARPAHWFARLECEPNRLRIHHSVCSQEFRRLVRAHPLPSHTKNDQLIVTASTVELQTFFSKTGEAAFDKPSTIVLQRCTNGEIIKPVFAGFDPFASPLSVLFGSAQSNGGDRSTTRLGMPPLTGLPYFRVKQMAEEFVRMGHEVRFIRGSKAISAERVYAVEAQEPLPGVPLRPNAAIILTVYCKDSTDPLPATSGGSIFFADPSMPVGP